MHCLLYHSHCALSIPFHGLSHYAPSPFDSISLSISPRSLLPSLLLHFCVPCARACSSLASSYARRSESSSSHRSCFGTAPPLECNRFTISSEANSCSCSSCALRPIFGVIIACSALIGPMSAMSRQWPRPAHDMAYSAAHAFSRSCLLPCESNSTSRRGALSLRSSSFEG